MRIVGIYAADNLAIALKSFRCATGHRILIMRNANLFLLEVRAISAN